MQGFFSKVYDIVAKIPRGKVTTYGQIALWLGEPRSARVVGWAMRAAPKHLNLPCHRVVNKRGEMSPKCLFGSAEIRRSMLISEGISFKDDGCIDMEKHIWERKTS